jgi:hypothetical protein
VTVRQLSRMSPALRYQANDGFELNMVIAELKRTPDGMNVGYALTSLFYAEDNKKW